MLSQSKDEIEGDQLPPSDLPACLRGSPYMYLSVVMYPGSEGFRDSHSVHVPGPAVHTRSVHLHSTEMRHRDSADIDARLNASKLLLVHSAKGL